jgi:hypothetical protein
MVVPEAHIEFLKQPLSFWLATASLENIPEPIKCTGIKFDSATDIFTCFVPLKFMSKGFKYLEENPTIALVVVDVHSYEGYQYKGHYLSHRDCTPEEEEFQYQYMKAFTNILETFGYSGQDIYDSYMYAPFVAINFQAVQVFDQSPKKGTGEQIATDKK